MTFTIYELISLLIIADALIALIIAVTPIGDDTIERWAIFRRYLPLTVGWTLLYAALAGYIAYLSFVVI